MEHKPKPLPFDKDSLKGISAQVNEWHHDKHYAGYVNKRNEVEQELEKISREGANANWSLYGELKRRETFNAAGQILHELYWDMLGGDGSADENLSIIKKINEDFGSFENWQKDMAAAGMSSFGWAILCFDLSTSKLKNFTNDTHNGGAVWGAVPLLALDVYEHAYYHDYGPDRGSYIKAWLANIDWEKVEEKFEKFCK